MTDQEQPRELDKELHFDIYRTIVLGHYFRHWGMAEYRKVVRRDDGSIFEVYSFPAAKNKHVYHFATVGLAEQLKPDGSKEGHEYFMVFDAELGRAEIDAVFEYIVDICAHSIKNLGHAEIPRVMGSSAFAPSRWQTKALLIDEPRGEAESFQRIDIGGSSELAFLWLIPIHESEYRFILDKGIDAFDKLEQSAELSIADVTRKAFC